MADEQFDGLEETAPDYTRDLIDGLIDELNDGVDGVTFDRDVLDTNRPEDWAAVELSGESSTEWADGRMIDQTLILDIWVCVSDRGSGILEDVQLVLHDFGQRNEAGWELVSRNYLYDLDKVMWRWRVTLCGCITGYVPAPDEPVRAAGISF